MLITKILFRIILLFFISLNIFGQFKKKPYLQNETDSTITVMWESINRLPCSITTFTNQSNLNSRLFFTQDGMFEAVINHSPEDTVQYYYIKFFDSLYDTVFFKSDTFCIRYNNINPIKFGFISDPHPATSLPEAQEVSHKFMLSNLKNMEKSNVDFFVIGGDLVDRGDAGVNFFDQWSGHINTTSYLASKICYWPTIGNHDADFDPEYYYYKKYHSLPNNEEYYSFDKGPIHIICLSFRNYQKGTPQYAWLEEDLKAAAKDNKIEFIFVVMHYTYYSSGYFNKFPDIKTDLIPLFEKYGVSAVLSGHDHHYERSYPIKDDKIDSTGITYFVSGGGGAYMLDTKPPQWHTAAISPQRNFHHCLIIEIIKDYCTIKCVPIDSIWKSPFDQTLVRSRKDFSLRDKKPVGLQSLISSGKLSNVKLKWEKLTNADNYVLQLSLDSTFSHIIFTDSSLVDTTCNVNLSAYEGEKIFWKVFAENAFCFSGFSELNWFTVPLNPPSDLVCSLDKNKIILQWKDNSNYENGFIIERKFVEDDWIKLDTVVYNSNIYQDTSFSNRFAYYRTYAYNATTISDYSNESFVDYPQAVNDFNFNYTISGNIVNLKIKMLYAENTGSYFLIRNLGGHIKEINNLFLHDGIFIVKDTIDQFSNTLPLFYMLIEKKSNGAFISSVPMPINLQKLNYAFFLSDNYPNPFNSSTRISYYLPEECQVNIELFDALGRKVKEVLNGNRSSGYYNLVIEMEDFYSGVYFFRLNAESKSNKYFQTKKILLLK